MSKRIEAGQRVTHKETERRGVAVDDLLACCTESETPVVWEGETGFSGTLTDHLVAEGPESAVADLQKCGAGMGAACCIFLAVGPSGASCERFGSLRYSLIFKTMNAKRHPSLPFPDCQAEVPVGSAPKPDQDA